MGGRVSGALRRSVWQERGNAQFDILDGQRFVQGELVVDRDQEEVDVLCRVRDVDDREVASLRGRCRGGRPSGLLRRYCVPVIVRVELLLSLFQLDLLSTGRRPSLPLPRPAADFCVLVKDEHVPEDHGAQLEVGLANGELLSVLSSEDEVRFRRRRKLDPLRELADRARYDLGYGCRLGESGHERLGLPGRRLLGVAVAAVVDRNGGHAAGDQIGRVRPKHTRNPTVSVQLGGTHRRLW